jgi:hypothetical protein
MGHRANRDVPVGHRANRGWSSWHGYADRMSDIWDIDRIARQSYGQGMSSAALHASCLSEYLRSDPDLSRPAREFFALQRVVVDAAWDFSTGADLALPHVDGPYPRGYRLLQWISNQIFTASVLDPELGPRFEEVAYMLKHPSSLATPGTLIRSITVDLRAGRRRRG